MANFKVRCIESNDRDFTVGKIYKVHNGTILGNEGMKYDNWSNSSFSSERDSSFESLAKWFNSACIKFELIHDLPRICYILGEEDNPLKVNEEFKIEGKSSIFRINECGERQARQDNGIWAEVYNESNLVNIINHPEKIIRRPQFSEDEKTLMRLYVKAGYPIFVRGEMRGQDNQLMVYCKEKSEAFYLPEKVLPQITIQSSPFNAAEYLEGLK